MLRGRGPLLLLPPMSSLPVPPPPNLPCLRTNPLNPHTLRLRPPPHALPPSNTAPTPFKAPFFWAAAFMLYAGESPPGPWPPKGGGTPPCPPPSPSNSAPTPFESLPT